MSVSGKGCEKCGFTGVVPFSDDAPWSMKRPCDACAEPWGPQPLDAPDGPGWWWMLVEGAAPEAVRVQMSATDAGPCAQVYTTRFVVLPLPAILAPAAKWLRIAAPEVPR